MNLEVVHDFPCPPDRFFDILEGEDLEAEIAQRSTSRRELVSSTTDAGVLVRTWRITPSRELPKLIQKLLGQATIPYLQTSRVNRQQRRVDWTIEVDVAQARERADIRGVLLVEPTAAGCRRTMKSTITVRVPVVGRKVERPVREAAYEPIRNNYWLLLAGIALLVFVALVLRAFWLALGRSDAYEGEELPGEAV